ncbi:MAG: SDR family NAD(P)-dependent oxidoreductase [Bdellovibrionales bacterium]
MKSVLVTGVAGFIGSRVAAQLMAQGVEVVGIDNMNDYYDVRLKQHRVEILQKPGFEFVELDIEDKSALSRLFQKCEFDVIFNLAARAGVRYSLENPHVYYTTNMMGTLNLLELARDHHVGKFVLASTSSLYAGEPLPFVESAPVNHPISPYAASKKAAELTCYTFHYHYGVDCTVVRYFTVYGPAGRPDMSIFRFIRWIDEGKPVEIFGDGEQSRDFTFIEDIARGTILAAKPLGFEIINLGGGRKPVTLNQVIRQIEAGLGKKAQCVHRPAVRADIAETQAEVSKAESVLGWSAEVGVEEGLQRTLDWYLAHRDFARHLDLP